MAKTEQDSNWTLEISDGKYHLHNEYQDFEGDVIFTPGQKILGNQILYGWTLTLL